MHREIALSALFALFGCGPAAVAGRVATLEGPRRDAPAPASSPESTAGPGVAFDLGLGPANGVVPSWVEARSGRPMPLDTSTSEPVVGTEHALHRTEAGTFLSQSRGPMRGPLAVPDRTTWLGFDEKDGIYAATAIGELFHVDRPEDALDRRRFQSLGRVEGAALWDAAGRFVVAASSTGRPRIERGSRERPAFTSLWISGDRGRHFEKRKVPGSGIADLFVRADGLVLATVGDTFDADGGLVLDGDAITGFVSPDAGRSWRRLARKPFEPLRLGGAIYAQDERGTFVVTESGTPSESPLPCTARFRERPYLGAAATPEPEACFTVDARAPKSGSAASALESMCDCPSHPSGCVVTTRHWWRDGFIVGDRRFDVPMTRTRFGLFDSTTCSTRDRYVEPVDPPGTGHISTERTAGCRAGAPLVHHGSIAIRDAGLHTLSLVELPAGLEPLAVLDAGGMGVVLARSREGDGGTRILTVGTDGSVHEEARAPIESGTLQRADDGTLVLVGSSSPRRGVRAFVRAPLELGRRDAWREVSREAAVSYAPLDGGRAVVGVDASKTFDDLELVVDAAGGAESLGHVRVPRDPEATELAFDGTHLFVHPRRDDAWLAVERGGRAVPSSSCLVFGRCFED